MVNFLLLVAMAWLVFGVPLRGSFAALAPGTLASLGVATAFGLLASAFLRSQIAAIFATAVLTILPATRFSRLIHPVSSLAGLGAAIGHVYPTT
jgi:ribosome-dependent ATPase